MEERIFSSREELAEYLKALPEDTVCRIVIENPPEREVDDADE